MPTSSFRILLVIFIICAAITSCSQETPVAYDNPLDPAYGAYIPSTPAAVAANIQSDTGVALLWRDESRAEDGFLIERRDNQSGYYTTIASLPPNATEYFDVFAVKSKIIYSYRIASFNVNGMSNYAREVVVSFSLPKPPMFRAMIELKTTILLQWSYPSSFQTGFVVERAVNSGPYSGLVSVGKSAIYFIDTDVKATNNYHYRLKAISKYNESPYSDEAAVLYSGSGN